MNIQKAIIYGLALVVCGFLFCVNAHAQTSKARLPGSEIEMEDAAKRANIILIAGLEHIGLTTPTSPVPGFPAEIECVKILKGTCAKQLSVWFWVDGVQREKMPVVGKTYIFFIATEIAQENKQNSAFKILPADDVTIRTVSSAIAASTPQPR